MNNKSYISLLAAGLFVGAVYAQNPTNPPPVASGTVTPSTPGAAVAPAAAPAAGQIVYTPRLPTAAELNNAAAAQGLTVDRIEQSPTQIVAVYKNAGGQTNTVSYQALAPVNTGAPAPTSPPPAVVYQPTPRVVYYDYYDPYYYPPVWYPPVSLRLGFGFGYRGGFRHGR